MLELRNDKPIASLAPQVAQAIQPLRGELHRRIVEEQQTDVGVNEEGQPATSTSEGRVAGGHCWPPAP